MFFCMLRHLDSWVILLFHTSVFFPPSVLYAPWGQGLRIAVTFSIPRRTQHQPGCTVRCLIMICSLTTYTPGQGEVNGLGWVILWE